MKVLGEWRYSAELRSRFIEGALVREWVERYPEIFDGLDVSQAESQPRNHFVEWLSAILIFETTRYLSLIEKYQFSKHERKQAVLRRLMSEEGFRWLTAAPRPCQGPDLLVYNVDHSDWFFVEVKGPGDRLRAVQREYFAEIQNRTGRPVFTVRLREL